MRTALLVVASTTGLLLARVLDGLGLLPGVAESEEVRRAALDPAWTSLGLLLSAALGCLAARVLQRSRAAATALLVAGQTGLVVLLEEAARELSGAPEPPGGETGLWVAALAQLCLALLATAAAVAVLALVPRALTAPPPARSEWRRFPPYLLVLVRTAVGAVRGRGPPVAARP